MRAITSLSCLLALTLTACDYRIDVDSDLSIEVKLGDLTGDCAGSETFEFENGTSTVLREHGWRSSGEEVCRFSIEYTYTVVDMANVREQIDAELRAKRLDPEDIETEIHGVVFLIDQIELTDQFDSLVAPPRVPFFGIEMSVEGDEFLHETAVNESFDQDGLGIPSYLDLSTAGVSSANRALEAGENIQVEGSIHLDLLESDRIRLGQELSQGQIEIDLTVVLETDAKVGLFKM